MVEVDVYRESELSDSQIASIVALTNSVWPKDGLTLEQRIAQEMLIVRNADRAKINPVRFVVWDGDAAISHALVFDRQIYPLDEAEQRCGQIKVLALAKVCCDASRRGEGLGMAVVEAAFQLIGEQKPLSLFQTGVPRFYEKLGGRIVKNRFVNFLSQDDRQANPWWDDEIMIVPGNASWPEQKTIDLNGPGY